MAIGFKKLTLENFHDFETLTKCESGGGCYCSYWHQKWASPNDWENAKKKTPELNRNIIYEKVRSGFHVGALAYDEGALAGWISVGPLPEFYWTWKRVGELGIEAAQTAGIVCVTIAPGLRHKGIQKTMLRELQNYGKSQGWKSIEGYPFDRSAVEKHKSEVIWPGTEKAFIDAGFSRIGAHWLSNPNAERSIYRAALN